MSVLSKGCVDDGPQSNDCKYIAIDATGEYSSPISANPLKSHWLYWSVLPPLI